MNIDNDSVISRFNVKDFCDYSRARESIVFRVLNYSNNEDRLKELAHIRFMDLAVTFAYLIPSGADISASITIKNSHLEIWHKTADDIFLDAKDNTLRLLSYSITNMYDILSSLLPTDEVVPSHDDMAFPMYVLTNEPKLYGAGIMLYEDVLEEIYEIFNDDYYILPSSIHELILIPKSLADDMDDLSSMVRSINETQLPEKEVLANHAYLYSHSLKALSY